MSEERAWEVWDEDRSNQYIRRYGTPQNPEPKHGRRMKLVASLLEGRTVLDVGCGIGHLYPHIKDTHSYLGIDNSDWMLQLARELQPECNFQKGDMYDLSPFGSFDSVVCQSLLIHLPEISRPIREMWGHTSKVLIFSIPISESSAVHETPYKEGYLVSHTETRESIEKEIANLGGVPKTEVHLEPGTGMGNTYFKVWRRNE